MYFLDYFISLYILHSFIVLQKLNFIVFLLGDLNIYFLFADESCAFEIQFDAKFRRGSSGVRSNEARIRGSIGDQPDHSRGQTALLEPKIARNSCVSIVRHKVLITRYITIAFIYRNCYKGPNDDVSVHVEWIDRYFAESRLQIQSSKYYSLLYLIKNIYIFLARPFHAFPFAGSPFSRSRSGHP